MCVVRDAKLLPKVGSGVDEVTPPVTDASRDSPFGKQHTTAERVTVTLDPASRLAKLHPLRPSAVPVPQSIGLDGLNWSAIPNEIRTSSAASAPRFVTVT